MLKFCALDSCVDASFWSEFGERKLNEYHLSEDAVPLTGRLQAARHAVVGGSLLLSSSSFGEPGLMQAVQGEHTVPGLLFNTNTLEAFLQLDRAALLAQAAQRVWEAIRSGAAEVDPALLCTFLITAFGDLKQWDFTYWACFPALKPPAHFQQGDAASLAAALGAAAAAQVAAACDAWRGVGGQKSPAGAGAGCSGQCAGPGPAPFWLVVVPSAPAPEDGSGASAQVEVLPLREWGRLHGCGAAASRRVLLAMADPSAVARVPGWPLRNALLMAACRWGVPRVSVLCCRDAPSGRCDPSASFVVDVVLPALPDGWRDAAPPPALGWEADSKGRLAPRHVHLAPLLNPIALAEQAVDLNLRLMRWRAAPALRVDAMAAQRCLLLGAGTLGCAVARCLLAWGVRHITLVDSGKVSFSNPVRQWLFTYEDCLGGGRPKAAAAAEQLRAIFPAVHAAGVELAIPMPGHPPVNAAAEAQMQQACEQLDALVAAHDVAFLLTDTRESRWLPTLLAAAHGKIAVTVALGFDGLLVMRHGLHAPRCGAATAAADEGAATSTAAPPPAAGADAATVAAPAQAHALRALGCYFCNDVVAPLNSMRDRSLDQQCTVSRPGLAPMAAALAVELVAALVQHPAGGAAPAQAAGDGDGGGGVLGPVPHMLRCQLTGFSQTVMHGQAFAQCTACSPLVLEEYARRRWGCVREAVCDPSALEALTGLDELHAQASAGWEDDVSE